MLTWFSQRHWSFWILFLLGILFLLWLFFGGKQYEFVGLTPLLPLQDDFQVEEVCSIERRINPRLINRQITSQDLPDVITCLDGDSFERKDKHNQNTEQPTFVIYDDDHIPNVPFPAKPSKWKRQEACCRGIEEIFGKPFRRDVRDVSWLYNPETGANLELDCYNEELGVAVEHNGEHHYKFPNHWNKTRDEWVAMVRRDKLKPDLCDQNGVYLVTIPYWVPFNKIKAEIRQQLEPLIKAHQRNQLTNA